MDPELIDERGGRAECEVAGFSGARVLVKAKSSAIEASPAALVQAIGDGWRRALAVKCDPRRARGVVTRYVRARADRICGSDRSGGPRKLPNAGALEASFEVAIELPCAVCLERRVKIEARWAELRDALAPEGLPEEFGLCKSIVPRPKERTLWAHVRKAVSYSAAKRVAQVWMSRFARGACPQCVASKRKDVLARLERLGGRIQKNATRLEAEQAAELRAAQERVARAREERVRRSQDEAEREGRIVQTLIRADARPDRKQRPKAR